jgi:NADPH-dependent 2,4-dienoyl-CoA reductase/sulfur reductase-like enzyme
MRDMKTRIVIAGGGFAGVYAAMYLDKTLARSRDVEVVLISRENFLLFTPMLHEVAAGDLHPSDIVNPLRRILRHVSVVEAEVDAIDLGARERCPAWQEFAMSGVSSASTICCSPSARKQTFSIWRECVIGRLP